MKRFSLFTAIITSLAFLVACSSAPSGTNHVPDPDPDVTPVPDPEPEPEEELAITIVAEQTTANQGELVDLSVEAEGPEDIQFEWAVTGGSLIDNDGFFTDNGEEVWLVTPHEEQTVTVTVIATAGPEMDADSVTIFVTADEAEFCADFGADPTDPCVIYTVEQLQMLADDDFLAGHFILGADIDASETIGWNSNEGFEPIGTVNSEFTGTFNGAGHTISGLTIMRSNENNVGLFGYTDGANIGNLKLRDIQIEGFQSVGGVVGRYKDTGFDTIEVSGIISAGSNEVGGIGGGSGQDGGPIRFNLRVDAAISGQNQVGGIFGQIDYVAVIDSAFSGEVSGTNYVGGISGKNNGGKVETSFSDATIEGNSHVGGLVGQNTNNAIITESFTRGSVLGVQNVGGLVGSHGGERITNSYSLAQVRGQIAFGGLVGNYNGGAIINTYSAGFVQEPLGDRGLIGTTSGLSVTDSYWDIEASTQGSSAADAEGLTSEEMTDEASFNNWGFGIVWHISEDGTPPDLINNSRF